MIIQVGSHLLEQAGWLSYQIITELVSWQLYYPEDSEYLRPHNKDQGYLYQS